MHRCALLWLSLLAACSGPTHEKVASTVEDPAPAGGVTTPTASSAAPDTAAPTAIDATSDTAAEALTGDPVVVECVPRWADCTSTTLYRDDDPATLDSEVRVYDSCGLPVTIEHYQGATVSLGFAYVYDADHFVTEEFMTFLGTHARRVYLYDGLRRLVQRDEDVGDNGTFEASEFYAYDNEGRLIEHEYFFRGERRQLIGYEHTGDAIIGSRATDDRDDGVLERIDSWDRSSASPIERFDFDGDGTDEEEVVYTLADDGLPLSALTVRPSDGVVVRSATWAYDADGRQLSHTVDERDDGTNEAESTTTWACP